MPDLKGVTKAEKVKYERCLKHVKAKNKKGGKKVNPYSVCYNSVIKKSKKKRKAVTTEFDYEIADDISMPNGYEMDMDVDL